jgi:hypothetical protein
MCGYIKRYIKEVLWGETLNAFLLGICSRVNPEQQKS